MEDKKNNIESLFEDIKEYLNSSIDLMKLKVIEKVSEFGSSMAIRILLLVVFMFFFVFLNIGIALWLGELYGKIFYGFFAVSCFYFFIALLCLLASKQIRRRLANFIITQLLK